MRHRSTVAARCRRRHGDTSHDLRLRITSCSARSCSASAVVGIFLNRKNVIVLLMAIELMLLAVNINFVAFSHYLGRRAAARSSCSSS